MQYYACKGAKLKCPMGSEQSELEVIHPTSEVALCDDAMACIMDYKPMVNIKPFGQCKSLANPVVAAATAANYGRLQEMPCIPNTSPWMPGKPNFLVKGQSALMDSCICGCAWALGVPIKITDAGQNFMSDGAEAGAGVAEQSASASAPVAAASGFQPMGLQPMSLPNLQTALDGIQLPQIPSFIAEIKGAAETIIQKVVNAAQSGNDIRSSAAADSNAKAKETKAKGESKAKEATESYKAIVKVEGEGKASQGQEITYKATVYDKDGPVEDCDVRWAIKVSENGAIDKNELKGMNGKRTIALKIKEEWIDKKEITIMPYLDSNSPKEDMSVKTNINPIAKTVYITQGNFIREVIQNFIKKNGHYPSEEMEKRLREEQIRENKEAHEGFKKYASEAKEKLEAKGFTVAIKNSMIEKEYNDMINDPNLIAYYMEAHGFYLEGECGENFQLPTGGFNLFKDKPDFSDDNWSLKDNNIDSITPEYFVLNEIPQLDLLLVYQISCENKFVDWSPHLGQSVEHFNDTEWDGKFVSEFKPKFEYVDKFVKEVIKKWDEKQGKP